MVRFRRSNAPEPGTRWQNRVHGRICVVVGLANADPGTAARLNMPCIVLHREEGRDELMALSLTRWLASWVQLSDSAEPAP